MCSLDFLTMYNYNMDCQRANVHAISSLTGHIVWATKYRYAALQLAIKIRCRTILLKICEAEGVQILKRVVSKRTCSHPH
jgi:putative transposase